MIPGFEFWNTKVLIEVVIHVPRDKQLNVLRGDSAYINYNIYD